MNIETTGKSSDSYYNGRYWYCSFSGIPSYSDNPKSGSGEVGHSEGQAMSSNVSNQRRNMGWGIGYVCRHECRFIKCWSCYIPLNIWYHHARQIPSRWDEYQQPFTRSGEWFLPHITSSEARIFQNTHWNILKQYWNNQPRINHCGHFQVVLAKKHNKGCHTATVLLDKPWKHTNNWPCLKP